MLKFYNTLTRKLEEFSAIGGSASGGKHPKVRLYSCGPTVYDFAHIGNLRTYIFTDVLRRALEYNGYTVKQVMNITDVGHLTEDEREEDKIEARARREKKSAWELARYYEKVFFGDLAKLNILKPSIIARATEHIKEQIALVKILEGKGYTYKTSDGLYFDVSKLKDYGKIGGQELAEKQAGARVPVGEKRHPADFALWKLSVPLDAHPLRAKRVEGSPIGKRQMEWPSPWGKGFPGWHIECSAMSVKYLGQPFDIHTGGVDHIGTHHTNEIAQSEAATGLPLANVWLHSEFLTVLGRRMGKSEGNLITVRELEEKGFSPLAYRYLVLGAHYRSLLNFTWESLQAAQNSLRSIYEKIRDWEKPRIGCAEYEENFLSALNDDLNTPRALAVLHKLVDDEKYPASARAKTLLKFDKVLGLEISKFLGKPLKAPARVKRLVAEREAARAVKDWKRADEFRQKIQELGYTILDTAEGPKVRKLNA